MKKYLAIIAMLTISSCTSITMVRVKTNPENSQISMRSPSGEVKVIGRGNVEMSADQFFSLGSRMARLEISKENYKTQKLYILQGKTPESYEIFVELEKELEDPKNSETRLRLEKLGKQLARATNAIHARKYGEAELTLNSLANDYPSVSVVFDLLGNLNYIQKNNKTALQHYQRSYQINPENVETKKMIDRLIQNQMGQ